jgi:hypothetical protein
MKNEPLKQWQQDVEDYGGNAYLMWEIRHVNSELVFTWHTAYSNSMLESACVSIIRRKQSAELPFDFERAKCGDEIEFYIELEKIQEDVKFIKQYDTLNIAMCVKNCNRLINFDDLRMKYPQKVKK